MTYRGRTGGELVTVLAGASVLVTGASGFIGSRLVRELEVRGAHVSAVSRNAHPAETGILWRKADLSNPAEVDAVFSATKPDVVFHLAGWVSGPRELIYVRPSFQDNLSAAVNVLAAATQAGCSRVVLAGSMEEADHEDDEVPSSPYAVAKSAQNLYARFFHKLYGTPVVVARIFMAYGPGQLDLDKLVPHSVLSNLDGRPADVASGSRPIDWVYVDDVVRGLVAVAEAPGIEGQTLDIGSGRTLTVGEMVKRIAAKLDAPAPHFGARPDRALETIRRAEPEKTFALTGFRPQVAVDPGLDSTIDWYRAERVAGRL